MNTKKLEHFLIDNFGSIDLLEDERTAIFHKANKAQKEIKEKELERIRKTPEAKEIIKELEGAYKIIDKAKLKSEVLGAKLRPTMLHGTRLNLELGDNNKEVLRARKEFERITQKENIKTVAKIIKIVN